MARLSPAPDQPSVVAGALGDSAWSRLDLDAFGGPVVVAVRGGGPALLVDGRQAVVDADARWNPRRPGSLTAAMEAGGPVPVDDETFALVEASVEAAELTGGAVGSTGIEANAVIGRVTVRPEGVLDLEDLARAWCADQVAESLVEAGAEGAVVDVAGALRLAGSPGPDRAWVVDVPGPGGAPVAAVGLAEGACVTVLRPTAALASVTVLAPDARTAIVPAAAADLDLLAATGLPAVVVADDGTVEVLGPADGFLRPARL